MMAAVEINKRQLADGKRLLKGVKNGAPKAISRAVNKTASTAKTETGREVRKELNLKAKQVNESLKLRRATFKHLSARLRISGKPIPLSAYGAKDRYPRGVSVKVRKTRKRERHSHAFIVTMPSGHIGVFERKSYGSGKRRAGRLPIEEQMGPSIPAVFSHHGQAQVEKNAAKNLEKNLANQVDFLLKKS